MPHSRPIGYNGGGEDSAILQDRSVNFRDLGGHPTRDGGRIRRGLLFRSGYFRHLTTRDRKAVEAMRIRTLIDLRSKAEVEKSRERMSAQVFHFPVDFDGNIKQRLMPILFKKNVEAEILEIYRRGYQDMVAALGAHLGRILEILSTPEAYPAVIHCRAGKDRTGLATALLLLALGVDYEMVLDDYLLSNDYFPLKFSPRIKLAELLSLRLLPTQNLGFILLCREMYLQAALQKIQGEFGSLAAYLESCGIPPGLFDRVRAILVEDAPVGSF